MKTPTPDELQRILKLCGNEAGVIALMAKQYGLPAEAIAPTVRGWLAALPPLPPPSRQRSAPANLDAHLNSLVATRRGGKELPYPGALPTPPSAGSRPGVPPASAPVQGRASTAEVVAAMRALDSRLNSASVAKNALAVKPSTQQRAGAGGGILLLPPTVPEHVPLALLDASPGFAAPEIKGLDEDMEAAAYLQRAALVHGQGRLEPRAGGHGDVVRADWMTRKLQPRF